MRRARAFLRKLRIRFGSLRLRLMLASAALAMLFMLLLMPALQGVFLMALEPVSYTHLDVYKRQGLKWRLF